MAKFILAAQLACNWLFVMRVYTVVWLTYWGTHKLLLISIDCARD